MSQNSERILLRVREIKDMTGFCETTIRALINSGEIPSLRAGRAVRVSRDALNAWIESQEKGVRADANQ